ncbi:MAG: HAD family hydrolase [Christensenellales bacterium]|jgi:Cof subfamily protein (haloacid dehalogenase superfamily)
MKTLYVTDLDGTLLNDRIQVSKRSVRIINRLVSRGMLFTYATARSLASAEKVTAKLDIRLPVVVYNGAFTIDAKTGEVLRSFGFNHGQKAYLQALLSSHDLYPLVYAYRDGQEKMSWLLSRQSDAQKQYADGRRDDPRMHPVAALSDLYYGDVFYLTLMGERDELMPVYLALADSEHYACFLQRELYTRQYWCEIMPRAASKAAAVTHLKERLGCRRVIAFGDGHNDLPMFEAADACYAVKNAATVLKKAATAVIGGNNDDAVALWLEKNYGAD